jgi:hypothetical protein
MANVVEFVIQATDSLTPVIKKIETETRAETEKMKKHWNDIGGALQKVGASIGGIGLAADLMARSQAPLVEQTRHLSDALNITDEAMKRLVISASDVSMDLQETLNVMEKGSQQGIRDSETLLKYAGFWNMVGSATGESSAQLAEASVALRSVGIAAGEEEKALASFGYITKETTGSVGNFLQFVSRLSPELNDLGLDIDSTAAILGALEKEFGMTARVARQEFRKAVNESEGDTKKLLETLGLTEEQFKTYRQAVEDSADVMQKYGDMNEKSFTATQKFQHFISEAKFAVSGYIEKVAELSPVLMGMGSMMTIVGTILKSNFIPNLLNAVSMVKTFSTVILANPLTWWVAGIGAVVGAVTLLYKNWESVVGLLDRTIQRISGWLEGLRQKFEILTKPIDWIVGKLDILKGKTESYLEKKEEEKKLSEEITKTAEPYMSNLENIADIQESSAERRVEAEKQVLDVFDSELGQLDSLGVKIEEVSVHHQALVNEYTKHIEGMKSLYNETGIMTGELYEIEKQKIEENRDKLLALAETQKLTAEQRASAEQKIIDKYEEQITKLNEIANKPAKQSNPIYTITDSSGNKIATNDPKQISQAKEQGLDIQKLHTGGMFRASTPGGEGLALLKDKEVVLPPGGGGVTINISPGAIQFTGTEITENAVRKARNILFDNISEELRRRGLSFA